MVAPVLHVLTLKMFVKQIISKYIGILCLYTNFSLLLVNVMLVRILLRFPRWQTFF